MGSWFGLGKGLHSPSARNMMTVCGYFVAKESPDDYMNEYGENIFSIQIHGQKQNIQSQWQYGLGRGLRSVSASSFMWLHEFLSGL